MFGKETDNVQQRHKKYITKKSIGKKHKKSKGFYTNERYFIFWKKILAIGVTMLYNQFRCRRDNKKLQLLLLSEVSQHTMGR